MVLADDQGCGCDSAPQLPTILNRLRRACLQVHLFEREIAERSESSRKGIRGSSPYVFNHRYENLTIRKASRIGVTDFYRVEGDGCTKWPSKPCMRSD